MSRTFAEIRDEANRIINGRVNMILMFDWTTYPIGKKYRRLIKEAAAKARSPEEFWEAYRFSEINQQYDTLYNAVIPAWARWLVQNRPDDVEAMRDFMDRRGPWINDWHKEVWRVATRLEELGVEVARCDRFDTMARWHDRVDEKKRRHRQDNRQGNYIIISG